jgi:hypothetical protein
MNVINTPPQIVKLISSESVIAFVQHELNGSVTLVCPMQLIMLDAQKFLLARWPGFRDQQTVSVRAEHVVAISHVDSYAKEKYFDEFSRELAQRRVLYRNVSNVNTAPDPQSSAFATDNSRIAYFGDEPAEETTVDPPDADALTVVDEDDDDDFNDTEAIQPVAIISKKKRIVH